VLDYAGSDDRQAAEAARRLRQATLDAAADGIRTFDLGGEASTSDVVDEVVMRMVSPKPT
jgi:isocitrate/isopropylmalate dehydrogenase